MTDAQQDAKTRLMDALREVLTARKEAIRERLLSCLADHVEQELNDFAEPPALDEVLLGTLTEGNIGRTTPASATDAPASPASFAELHDAMQQVTQCGEQVGILENLMAGAARFSSRVVVFVCRNGEAVGWEQSGFAANPYSMAIRGVTLSLQENSVLSHVVSTGKPFHGTDAAAAESIWSTIGTDPSHEFTAIPLTVQGRIAAVLFADSGCEEGAKPVQPEALTILARMAEMSLETMSLRDQVGAQLATAGAETAATETDAAAPEASPDQTVSSVVATAEPSPEVADPSHAHAQDDTDNQETDIAAEAKLDSQSEQVSTEEEEAAPEAAPSEDDQLHEQARRFARLLVSEILLYHPNEVQEGKLQHDLYQRLRPDLERSEQMYRNRVAPEVCDQVDYFQEEVVRTLADGDASLLGNN